MITFEVIVIITLFDHVMLIQPFVMASVLYAISERH